MLSSRGATAQHARPAAEGVAVEAPEFARGEALRAEHRDAEALALFEELYARTHEPRALAQVGLAEAALGRWLDAEAHLIEALTALRDPWVMHNRMSLLATLESMRSHVGVLVVDSDVETAEVWIDGRRAGPVGAPVHVLAGAVRFEVRAEGRATITRSLDVAPNTTARADVRFNSDDVASVTNVGPSTERDPQSEQGASNASGASNVVVSVAPPTTASVTNSSGSTQRSLGWAGVGTGAALIVGGVAAWFLASAATDAYNNDASCPGVGAPTQSDACTSTQRTAETLEPIAWIAGGVGLALVVTGSVLVATSGDRRAASRVTRQCAPVLGPWSGVSCGLSF